MKKKEPTAYAHLATIIFVAIFLCIMTVFVFLYSTNYVEVEGVVKPGEYQLITPRISGVLKKKHFKDGDPVSKNDLLIEMESENYINELHKLEIEKTILADYILFQEKRKKLLHHERQIQTRKTNYELYSLKAARGYKISEKDYQEKIAQIKLSKLSLEKDYLFLENNLETNRNKLKSLLIDIAETRQKIAYCKVHSEINGIIIEDDDCIKEGRFFSEGDKIQEVYSNMDIFAQLYIPESKIAKIRLGQTVKLYVTAIPYTKYKVFEGKIISLKETTSNLTDNSQLRKKAFYIAKVQIDSPYFKMKDKKNFEIKKLIFGMTLKAKINIGKTTFLYRFIDFE